ncbi:MAG: PH domain-containing protein [Clostridia bacterium]|nr:PH domain-containing protein [Clostridia bacterium]
MEKERIHLTKNALKCWYLRWLLAFVFLLALELATVRLATNLLYGITLAAIRVFALSLPAAFAVAVTLAPYLRYKGFSYMFDGGKLLLFSGVLSKKRLSLPLSNIQHTELRALPFERFYKLATLRLYTAGSEHTLPSIALEDARRIQRIIYDEQHENS